MNTGTRLVILYLEIGRGHPFYLDGVALGLTSGNRHSISIKIAEVLKISRGVSRRLWKLVGKAYGLGSRGKLIGSFYGRLRSRRNPNKFGSLEKILARNIREEMAVDNCPILVSHPLLVPMLGKTAKVYYQHGEIAVPSEAAVKDAAIIFVPTRYSRERFIQEGIPENKIVVSGLCIEEPLLRQADECFRGRIKRYRDEAVLTGAFFSSGAEPPDHIEKIVLGVLSLKRAGQRGMVFCRQGGRLWRKMIKAVPDLYEINHINKAEQLLGDIQIILISYGDRADENELTARAFPIFDYLVVPSHERSNWAIGLGLPAFILHPLIGNFAVENCRFLREHQVASDIVNNMAAKSLAARVIDMQKSGELAEMAQKGYGQHSLAGFRFIADYLVHDVMEGS